MARKRNGGDDEGGANWMDTYGDMITLVLTFFVLLYSMSSMDKSKWQYIAAAFSKGEVIEQVPVDDELNPENDKAAIYSPNEHEEEMVDFDDLYMYLDEVIKSNELQDSVSLEMSKTGIYMRFRDNIFFGGDSAELLPEGEDILDMICDGVKNVNEMIFSVKVSGFTAESSGSSADEWNLSTGRSNSVINFMIDKDTCEEEKFSSAGYGKNRPIAENDTEEGRRQNRRVEIVFIRNDIDYSDPAVVAELLELEFGTGFISNTGEADEVEGVEGEYVPPSGDGVQEYVSPDDILGWN